MAKILKLVCLMMVVTLVLLLGAMAPIFGSFSEVSANEEPPPEEPEEVPEEEIVPEEPEPVLEEEVIPTRLLVRDLYITPVNAQPRQAVAITAKVVNEGGIWGSETVELIIKGRFEQSQNVGVSPGTAQPISFTVYKVEPGEYKVNIDGNIGTFYVTEEAPPPAPQKSGLLTGGELDTGGIIAMVVIGIILVGGLTTAFMLARRT